MKTQLIYAILVLSVTTALAFPPAPYHEVYGTVRDQDGRPLSGGATVTLLGNSGKVVEGTVDRTIGPGVNYSVKVPMDAGSLAVLYQNSALQPAMPYVAHVTIGGVSYLPIEVQGGGKLVGEAGGRTRLDLTLGVDTDGDGLPDAWEERVIRALGLGSLADVTKDGDSDGDGVSNFVEYLAGTYAFDRRAVFALEILEVKDGIIRMRFLAVTGRSYTLHASADGRVFRQVPFSLEADGSNPQNVHRAESIRYQDVYVEAESFRERLFRLHVE